MNSVKFSFDNRHFQNVSFIQIQKTSIFDILVPVKWLLSIKQVDSPKMKSMLRQTVLYDDSGSIRLTVWGDVIDLMEKCKIYKFDIK